LGLSSTATVFRGTPAVAVPPRTRPSASAPTRLQVTDGSRPEAVRGIAAQLPARAWRRVSWRNGTNRPWTAQFAALRVMPAQDWRRRRLAPEVWLLLERDLGTTPRVKAYLVALPPTASLRALVRLAHHRWAIEQQYQELKDELGLDHFEGRSYPGWNRHVLLTALAYTWLQHERRRAGARLPSLPVARAVITEVLTAHFFVTHPHYLQTMMKFRDFHLRI
jgi:SRSO17 transposase